MELIRVVQRCCRITLMFRCPLLLIGQQMELIGLLVFENRPRADAAAAVSELQVGRMDWRRHQLQNAFHNERDT